MKDIFEAPGQMGNAAGKSILHQLETGNVEMVELDFWYYHQ